jgi:protein-S-isoprenylcysteine O-methyltransferase Ste14
VLATGLVLVLWPARDFERAGTTMKPFEDSTTLVTTGAYRLSRNPMYLGMAAVLAGIGLLLGSLLPLLVVPTFAVVMDVVFIRPEERMLRDAFGDSYLSYARRVRRWL